MRALALAYPACLIAAGLACVADFASLVSVADARLVAPFGLPTVGLHLRLDPLAAFFGLIINIGVLACSIHGLGLDRERELSARVEPIFQPSPRR